MTAGGAKSVDDHLSLYFFNIVLNYKYSKIQ